MKLVSLTSLFAAALVISNVIAGKVVQVGFWLVPAAVFAYPVTFALTDIISEIWGKRTAQKVVWIGFAASIVLVFYINLAIWLKPAPFYELNEQFKQVLGGTARIVIASLLAYIASQTHDVFAFHFWKKVTKAKHLWLRNNASTMVSQLIDTAIFIPVAFYGIVPTNVLLNMMISQYTLKLIIALLDTPIVYLGVKLLTGNWIVKEEWKV